MTKKNYVSGAAFRCWVAKMCNEFAENGYAITISIKNTTYVYLRSKVGVAKCNSADVWDRNIGIAYAWARCTGQKEYYEEEENKYIPKAGEWVSVKTADGKSRYLKYISEGVDNYCFKIPCGRLILIDKDRVIKITPAK